MEVKSNISDAVYVVLLLSIVCGTTEQISCDLSNSDLTANCSNRGLKTIPNNLPANITVLDASGNFISELEGNNLSRYRNLHELYLNNNKMRHLETDIFNGMDKLRVLSLAGNKLTPTNYSVELFMPLSNLEKIYLHRNLNKPSPFSLTCKDNICYYPDDAFSVLVNLKVLSIDLCENSTFGPGFLNLTRLESLTFDYCLACQLDNETFQNFRNSNIKYLNLSRCQQYKSSPDIEIGILVPFKNVLSLDLSNSYFSLNHALKLLYPFQNKTMDMINFHRVSRQSRVSSDNPFKITITKQMMQYLKTICVKTLILSYNGIVDSQPESLFTYDKPQCFEQLIISANSFSLGYNILYMEVLKLTALMVNLKLFDYSYVPYDFANKRFILPPNFSVENTEDVTLDFDASTIQAAEMTFFLPPKLESLRFSHVMTLSRLFTLKIRGTANLKFLDLSYFQFGSFPTIIMPEGVYIEYFDFSGVDSSIYVDKGVPELMKDMKTVVLRDCNLDRTLKIGKNVFRSLRNNTINLDISQNHLEDLPETFSSLSSLQSLNLSTNSFRHFPKELLTIYSLKRIDFRFNRLLTLEKDVTQWLDCLTEKSENFTLLLTGNEFSCSCQTMAFIRWLSITKVKLDQNGNYSCRLSNGTLTNTKFVVLQYHDIFSNCNAFAWLRIGVICIVSSFVAIGVSAIIYQFRWRMTYFFYRKLKIRHMNDTPNLEFRYDVFVAYARDSTEWLIYTLIPKLEQDWNFNVCIKDRDFPVGADRADTVISSIRNSKHVIFIITPGFIKRKFGKFEIEMAKFEMFEQRRQKQIIIIRKDGVKLEDVPIEFSVIWKDIVMIEWPPKDICTENVWHNLKLQLT